MILVVGHPRSGTGGAARRLQSAGLDVGHESFGKHGISAWQASPNANTFYLFNGQNGKLCIPHPRPNPTQVIHVVRNPFDVVASSFRTERNIDSLNYRKKFIYISEQFRALDQDIASVLGWHVMIRSNWPDSLMLKIEDIDAWKKHFKCEDVGQINVRQYPPITLDEWMACDAAMLMELVKMAATLGYPIPEGIITA